MASNGKKKTTMAKLNRESKLRERRADKAARKDARKYAAEHPPADVDETLTPGDADPGTEQEPSSVDASTLANA